MQPLAFPYRHIIWDWNGTLLDDTWLCLEIINGMLRARSLPTVTLARYHEVFDFPVIDYYRRLGFDFGRESFAKLGTEFIAEYERRRHESALHPAASRALAAFHRSGRRQSVLSAYRHEALEQVLERFRVRCWFEDVLGADDHYAHGKQEQGLRLITRLGEKPADCLLIGDTAHDHEVAQAMGTACWLVEGGHHPRPKLARCGVPVFASLDEVLARAGLLA